MAFTPGTYEGVGRGYRGKLPVSVTVSEDKIEAVVVGKHKEVRGIAWGLNTTPIELYPKWIVEYQSLNIPSILGADTTCAALMQAVVAALKAAGATDEDIAALKAKDGPKLPAYVDEEITVDVLVAGGGAGGLAAAIEATLGGAKVLLVEKQGVTGGSTARSGGKLLACDSKAQKKQGIYDNADMTYDYLMEVGNRRGNLMDGPKTRYLVDHLNQTIDWLSSIEATIKGDEEIIMNQPWDELKLHTSKPYKKDGVLKTHFEVLDVEAIHVSLQPWRVHNSPGGGGQTNGQGGEISVPLTLYYENDLGGEIQYYTALKELMIDAQGKVVGAICERYNGAKLVVHTTKGVVLATGGYARNRDMVIPYYPVGDDYFSNIPRGQVGDGLVAAEKIGAKNFKHPAIQTVYTSLTNGIGINDESGLIVNEFGNRVVNEWTYQYTVGEALMSSGSKVGWYITSGKEPYGGVQFGFSSALKGRSKDPVADSIEELAEKIGCNPAVLRKTFDRYCELVEKGVDEDFGKPAEFLHPIQGPKYAALRLHPCVVVSFGGLETDNAARVLRPDGSYIPNLFAAGEVAGTGMYGTQYPTCGTSIGSALFFGRNAGRMLTNQSLL